MAKRESCEAVQRIEAPPSVRGQRGRPSGDMVVMASGGVVMSLPDKRRESVFRARRAEQKLRMRFSRMDADRSRSGAESIFSQAPVTVTSSITHRSAHRRRSAASGSSPPAIIHGGGRSVFPLTSFMPRPRTSSHRAPLSSKMNMSNMSVSPAGFFGTTLAM